MKVFTKKIFKNFEDMYQDMLNKKNDYYNHKIDKYVISYKIKDKNHLEVKSNIGRTRIVENSKSNRKRLSQVIVRSKVEIARRIDKYEKEANQRLIVLLLNSILIALSGFAVIGTLFVGNFILLLFSLLVFSLILILASTTAYNYYFLIKEIKSLKTITGYKKENEIELPRLNINNLFKPN